MRFDNGRKRQFPHHRVQPVSLFRVCLIERLGPDLEAQAFHRFKDMVVAFERQDVLVADGVVALLVVQIHQRRDLRELVGDMLQQRQCLPAVFAVPVATLFEVKLHNDEPFVCVRVADDDVT